MQSETRETNDNPYFPFLDPADGSIALFLGLGTFRAHLFIDFFQGSFIMDLLEPFTLGLRQDLSTN